MISIKLFISFPPKALIKRLCGSVIGRGLQLQAVGAPAKRMLLRGIYQGFRDTLSSCLRHNEQIVQVNQFRHLDGTKRVIELSESRHRAVCEFRREYHRLIVRQAIANESPTTPGVCRLFLELPVLVKELRYFIYVL